MPKSGVEYLARHLGWKTVVTKKANFFDLLSGEIPYSDQWEEWDKLCKQNGTDGDTVFGLLSRAQLQRQNERLELLMSSVKGNT